MRLKVNFRLLFNRIQKWVFKLDHTFQITSLLRMRSSISRFPVGHVTQTLLMYHHFRSLTLYFAVLNQDETSGDTAQSLTVELYLSIKSML